MNWDYLFEIAAGLDFHTKKEQGLLHKKTTHKKMKNLKKILSKLEKEQVTFKIYIEGFHYVLSIGIELQDYKYVNFNLLRLTEINKTESINKIKNHLKEDLLEISYIDIVYEYVLLGINLDFSLKQIETAYIKMNKILHQQQLYSKNGDGILCAIII